MKLMQSCDTEVLPLRALSSGEPSIYYWKCIYYYRGHVTEALGIRRLISSLKIMKLFGKDSGSQIVGQGTSSSPPEGPPDEICVDCLNILVLPLVLK